MTVRVVVHQSRIDRLLHGTGGPIGVALQNTGINIESRAKRLVPVDTGRLRASIVTTRPLNKNATEMHVLIGSKVNYARFVELGTRYMRARPYLRPALEQEVR